MKKTIFLFMIMTLVVTACSFGNSPLESGTQPEKETEAAPADSVDEIEESATPTPSKASWELPDPPDANQLPTELNSAVSYIQPPENCAKENDPNVTCSTIKGQNTEGDFSLKSNQALVMTGDAISITQNGKVLVPVPSYDTNHDLWVVVNASSKDLDLHMSAPHGSFRGYFAADGGWDVQKVAHLRNLHLYLFLLPEQTTDRFTPTPVPNCESKYGCEQVNVRVMVFDNEWHVAAYGLYLENQPFWQDLLQMLGFDQ